MLEEEIIKIDSRVYEFIEEIRENHIFYNAKDKVAYCSICNKEYIANEEYIHNEYERCKECNNELKVSYTRYGRKGLTFKRNILTFKKDKNELIGVGYYIEIDWMDYRKPNVKIEPMAYYIFSSSEMYRYNYYNKKFVLTGSMYEFNQGWLGNYELIVDYKNFNKLADGTFKYIKGYFKNMVRPIKFLDMYIRYPDLIEKMLKMNLGNLINNKLMGCTRTFTLGKKTVYEALGLTKAEYRYITNIIKADEFNNVQLQWIRKMKDICSISVTSIDTLKWFHKNFKVFNFKNESLDIILKLGVQRYKNYIDKQMSNLESNYQYTFILYRDYINFLKKLDIEITKNNITPKDLKKAHDLYSKKIKLIKKEEQDKKINIQIKKLNKYKYENENYLIRPAMSAMELINEGEKLNHCVATYIENYSEGKTGIFVIRDKKFTNKPLVTVEIKNGNIIQAMAKNNKNPTEEVNEFIEEFKSEKLENNKRINKSA